MPATRTTRGRKALRWERRPDERPQELLDAALRVFAERGYRRTRLETVAEAAGVTKGTIYYYFATKEELLLRAVEHYQARAFGRLEDALRGARGSAAERIGLFVRGAFGSPDPARAHVLTLLMQGLRHEAEAVYARWLANGPVRGWRMLAGLVREGVASGEFRPEADADVAARVLLSGLMLQLLWQPQAKAVAGVAIARERLIESALEHFLAGLRAA